MTRQQGYEDRTDSTVDWTQKVKRKSPVSDAISMHLQFETV